MRVNNDRALVYCNLTTDTCVSPSSNNNTCIALFERLVRHAVHILLIISIVGTYGNTPPPPPQKLPTHTQVIRSPPHPFHTIIHTTMTYARAAFYCPAVNFKILSVGRFLIMFAFDNNTRVQSIFYDDVRQARAFREKPRKSREDIG